MGLTRHGLRLDRRREAPGREGILQHTVRERLVIPFDYV
jgi:hypothetical protein